MKQSHPSRQADFCTAQQRTRNAETTLPNTDADARSVLVSLHRRRARTWQPLCAVLWLGCWLVVGSPTVRAAAIPSYSQPSVLSDFVAVAETDGNLQAFDRFCSLNNHGQVGFIAQRSDGEGVYRGQALQAPLLLAFPSPAVNRDYSFVQLADTGRAVVRLLVSGPTTSVRLADPSGETRIAQGASARYNTVTLPSVNNLDGVLFASLESDSTVFNWNLASDGEVTLLATNKAQGFAPRAMLDDRGGVVYRDPVGQTVYAYLGAGGRQIDLIAPTADRSGRSPGISDDGEVIVFYGERDEPPLVAQPGVFLVQRLAAGGWGNPIRLAGLGDNDQFDPGEAIWTDKVIGAANGNVSLSRPADYARVPRIQAFVPDRRCNVNRIGQGLYRYSFTATVVDADGSTLPGLYSGTFQTERAVIVSPPKLVVKGGDTIRYVAPAGHQLAVTDLDAWDVVNTRNELAFWSRSTGSEAIVKTRRIIDPLRQNDHPWGPTPYAAPELAELIDQAANPQHPDHSELAMLRRVRDRGVYNFSAVGCYITSTTMALEALGAATLSPGEVYAILDEPDQQGQRGITALGSLLRNTNGTPQYRVTGVPTFVAGDAKMDRVFSRYQVVQTAQNNLTQLWNHLVGATVDVNRAALVRVGGHWIIAMGHRGEEGETRVRLCDPWESWNGTGKDRMFAATESADFRNYLQGRGFKQARILTRQPMPTLLTDRPPAALESSHTPVQAVFRHRGPIRALLTGANGVIVGWDSESGRAIANVEGAEYAPSFPIIDGETELGSENEAAFEAQANWEMLLPNLPTGDYKLRVLGLASGEFAVEGTTYHSSGATVHFQRKEPITAGQTKEFEVLVHPIITVPRLTVALEPDHTHLTLRWPSSITDGVVQLTVPQANPQIWSDLTSNPQLIAGEWVTTVPTIAESAWFRLWYPTRGARK